MHIKIGLSSEITKKNKYRTDILQKPNVVAHFIQINDCSQITEILVTKSQLMRCNHGD